MAVVSPFVGIAMGIPGLAALTLKLVDSMKDFVGTMKVLERDVELLNARFDLLTIRYISLQQVLFQEDKFPFVQGTIFNQLSSDQQRVLQTMFRELARVLYECYQMQQSRNVSLMPDSSDDGHHKIMISPEELGELFSEAEYVPKHGAPKFQLSWTAFVWAASTKKHVENIANRYEEWLNRVRETIEDFWWPRTFFDKFANLQSIEADKDCRTVGLAVNANLRKLLVPDAPVVLDLELKTPLESPKDTNVPLRKLSKLEGLDVLVEILPIKPENDGFLSEDVKLRFSAIAGLLHAQKDAEFSVLRCIHWREDHTFDGSTSRTSFQLITALPSTNFKSLNDVVRMARGPEKPSLDCRLQICYRLARTLSLCHSVGWLHRNIRSGNVLFFDATLGDPKLCGFEESRKQDDFSMRSYGDNTLESNVYRHPTRWGSPTVPARFNVYHDIYSFGVLLLEIGLWEPIMQILSQPASPSPSTTTPTPKSTSPSPTAIHRRLLAASAQQIGHKCGTRYASMIQSCLNGTFTSASSIDVAQDTQLQTNLQLCFRSEIVDGLREEWEAVRAPQR